MKANSSLQKTVEMLQQARRQTVSQSTKDDRSMHTLGSSRPQQRTRVMPFQRWAWRNCSDQATTATATGIALSTPENSSRDAVAAMQQPAARPVQAPARSGQNKQTHPGPAARHTCPITSTGAAVSQAAWWASPARQADTGRRELAPDLFRCMDSRNGARLSHTIHRDTTTVPEQGSSPERNAVGPSPSSGWRTGNTCLQWSNRDCGRPAGLCQPTFPPPEARRPVAGNLQVVAAEHARSNDPLQDETIHHLKEVVRRGDFVARLDLKDAGVSNWKWIPFIQL